MTTVPIIMYHSVNDDTRSPHAPLAFRRSEFLGQLRALRAHGLRLVSMAELWDGMRSGSLDPSSVAVLTFDDGYVDNLRTVSPILADYGARATVFVNPAMTSTADRDYEPDSWGTMTQRELVAIRDTQVFDVESHCATHDRVFSSSQVVELYDRTSFDRYYWMAWRLDPATRRAWRGDLYRHSDAIPEGYPVLESERGLIQREFRPDREAIGECIEDYRVSREDARSKWAGAQIDGDFESLVEFVSRRREEVVGAKRTLERWLDQPVRFVCFPGGAYDDGCLDLAREAGFKGFMLASRIQGTNDAGVIDRVVNHQTGDSPVGFKRISFSNDIPRLARNEVGAFASAWLKIGIAKEIPMTKAALQAGRVVREIVRRK